MKSVFIFLLSLFFFNTCLASQALPPKQFNYSPNQLCEDMGIREDGIGPLVSIINDVSLLNATNIYCLIQPTSIEQIAMIVSTMHKWNQTMLPEQRISLSISGTRHSQGGHIANSQGITLDLRKLNHVGSPEKQGSHWELKVQAGALWQQVHDEIKIHGRLSLANKVQQSSTPFSIGGSLAVNCHGRSFSYGSMIHSVRAITLVSATGEIIHASRAENNEIFRLAIGGYGLFGVIVEIELELIENHRLAVSHSQYSSISDYIDEISVKLNEMNRGEIIRGSEGEIVSENYSPVAYLFATVSLDKGNFLTGINSYIYTKEEAIDNTGQVNPDNPPNLLHPKALITKLGFSLKRNGYLVKTAQKLQSNFLLSQDTRLKTLTPPIKAIIAASTLSEPDLLQEYFVPVSKVPDFLDTLKSTFHNNEVILSNVSLRFIPRSSDRSFLSYTLETEDQFAIVLYFSMPLDEKNINKAQTWTRELVKRAIELGGRHYLPYQTWPTKKQVKLAYPMLEEFMDYKKKHDSAGLFSNNFYQQYR